MNSSIRSIKVTNTLSGQKEELKTRNPGKLTFYSCGPTVYNLIHIGNLRGGLVSDLFFRYFQRVGYEVNYVRNYTDVDDKIIKRANEEGLSSPDVASKYIQEVEKDFKASGMLDPTHKTTVTTHIPQIISMIETIIQKGHAYVIEGGEVLFSIASFPEYGKLSHKKIDDLVAGTRVEVNTNKRNPLDFTLWKPAKPKEPSWDSPWGKGRPGWHIECSAMASRWLGNQIDVHHGGEDLIFPHHENEIAQSEAATHQAPFVQYWLHHAFLTFSKEKMSKSLGNVFTAREFLTQYSGELARYFLLSVHYRSQIDFCIEAIENALTGLHRLYEAKARAVELVKQKKEYSDLRAESAWGGFIASCEKAKQEIDAHFANDFNTPAALGSLFSAIREFNRTLQVPLAQATGSAILGASELIKLIEEDIGGIMGFGRLESAYALEEIARMRMVVKAAASQAADGRASQGQANGRMSPLMSDEEILAAIADRNAARKTKDFAKADEIRKHLLGRGIQIKDGPSGTSWERI